MRPVVLALTGLAAGAAIAFAAVAPPEDCPQPTDASIEQAATASTNWFVRNQRPDGTWLYQYDKATGQAADAYNLVRHAGAVMGLYAAASAGIPGALESADRGLAWARDHLIEHDGWTALADEQSGAPTGGAALLVAGLAERRILTGDRSHDDLMRSLGRFMAAMTLPDGAVIAQFDPVTMEPDAASRSKYYTGESYWALARLHRLFPHDGFGAVADRIGNYLATERDDVEDHWPPVPDHWVAYGLAETVHFPERDPNHPLTDAELAYARRQAGIFGTQVRWVSQQAGPWGVAVRGTHVPRGGGYGVVGEALTGLWRVAEAEPRLADLRDPIADRAECIAGLSISVQQRGGAPAVDGAWFMGDITRMDDQQHATSALLRTQLILDTPGSSGHPAPTGWLWGLALLALLDPLAVGLAVPQRRNRGERATLAAVGTVAGSVLVIAAALLGEPLFDLLHVSLPAGRLAVATVAGLFAAVRIVRRAPEPQPGPPGLAAALVPVAVPLVASPGLVLLALAAGADRGAGFVAGVMALGVGLVTASTLVPHHGTWRAVTTWALRLVAAVAVVACVLLGVNAVLDV